MQDCINKSEVLNKLGNFVRVKNLESPRTGRAVANQFEIVYENGRVFQSYNTLIGVRTGGNLYLTSAHEYSTTTSKYCTEWCGFNLKERRDGLKSGRFYQIAD